MGAELGKVNGLVARAEVSLHELSSSTDIEKAKAKRKAVVPTFFGANKTCVLTVLSVLFLYDFRD